MSAHDRSIKKHTQEDEDDDPVECMLRKAGCLEQHYSVQVWFSNSNIL